MKTPSIRNDPRIFTLRCQQCDTPLAVIDDRLWFCDKCEENKKAASVEWLPDLQRTPVRLQYDN